MVVMAFCKLGFTDIAKGYLVIILCEYVSDAIAMVPAPITVIECMLIILGYKCTKLRVIMLFTKGRSL